MKTFWSRTREAGLSILAVLAFLAAWEAVCRLGLVSPVLLTPPSGIAAAGLQLLGTQAILADLLFTVKVFLLALAVATVVGVGLGFAIGYSPVAYRLVNPFIVAFNSLPKIVLMPLVVLWLGIGISANLFLGAFMASFPVIIGTYTGVSCLERDFTLLAKSFGASRGRTLWTIVLPGLTPYVLSGLRLGVNYAMVGILIAEFFASNRGMGYRMVLYMSNFEVAYFFVCMVIVVVLTLAATSVVYGIERYVQAWRPAAFEGASGDLLYRGGVRETAPRTTPGGPVLQVEGLTMDFASNSGGNLRVLDGISLAVAPGEFLSVIGPSGCGKTTLLHTLNGLLRPTAGRVEVGARRIELVFQRPHLLPWRTLLDNATYGLECRGLARVEARHQATHLLGQMRLEGHLSYHPHQLSEGMKQRVNLARALLVKPDLLLMDEPFANLDEITRRSLQDDLLALWSEYRFTIVFVSHSVEEVVYLSDRVAILTDKPTVIQEMVALDLPRPRGAGADEKLRLLAYEERIKKTLTL